MKVHLFDHAVFSGEVRLSELTWISGECERERFLFDVGEVQTRHGNSMRGFTASPGNRLLNMIN